MEKNVKRAQMETLKVNALQTELLCTSNLFLLRCIKHHPKSTRKRSPMNAVSIEMAQNELRGSTEV
jgi:hypothetical protein